jgi:hypothetical protein
MTAPLDAADEVFHPAGEDPYWMESAWFGFPVPERDMNGFVYFFHDVRTGVSGGGPAVWDPSGEETYDCRFYDWRWIQPVTGPLDFRDFRLPNGLRHEVVEPMRRYRLSYSGLGLDLDLEWTALMAPHEIDYGDLATMTGARHFDQPGQVTGSLVLHGDRIEVDSWSLRDRTWGPHRPGASRSGDYLWAIASPEAHWHVITHASDEPGVDTVMHGYLVRDGELGELVHGERRVLERRRGAPVRVVLDAADDRGRTLHAEGDVRTALRWFGWPGRMAFWTLTDWRWDGVQGWGEDQEFFPRDQIRSLTRARDETG